jgi:dolichyl-phosphate beta-glucosyltransferase
MHEVFPADPPIYTREKSVNLSIVIPAFEESKKIGRDVAVAADFLQANGLAGEVIVVDDGSRDDTAKAAEEAPIPPAIERRVVRYPEHRGKGCAVRTGVKAARSQYVMFADCGLCIPYGNALLGLELLQGNQCDIAHASRRLIQSDILQDQPWHRRLISYSFRSVVRTVSGVPRELTDTQCGFKIYKGDVAKRLYDRCITDGFMFDVEIVLRAVQEGYRIAEFPVEWTCDPDSRLSVAKTPWPVLAELIALRRILKRENGSASPQ